MQIPERSAPTCRLLGGLGNTADSSRSRAIKIAQEYMHVPCITKERTSSVVQAYSTTAGARQSMVHGTTHERRSSLINISSGVKTHRRHCPVAKRSRPLKHTVRPYGFEPIESPFHAHGTVARCFQLSHSATDAPEVCSTVRNS